mmetsp:Transcript_40008/g.38546  ORF Transcript_40008/g.38546 Transcript_40008/m.38546 type:complete len:92 (+) Transcript_40008:412-687(+)
MDVLNDRQFLAVPLMNEQHRNKLEYKDLREKDLETVIPKGKDQEVVIVKGEFKGEVGKILSKDQRKEEVIVQFGITGITKLSLDDCTMRAM